MLYVPYVCESAKRTFAICTGIGRKSDAKQRHIPFQVCAQQLQWVREEESDALKENRLGKPYVLCCAVLCAE